MNEELKNIWGRQPARGPAISPEVIWQVAQASARFERTIFWRDAREWVATVLVAGFFACNAFAHGTLRWLSLLAAVIACFPMAYASFLRRRRPVAHAAGNVAAHLRAASASVRQQVGLLKSVLWWYLLPIAFCLLLLFVERRQWERGLIPNLIALAFVALIFVGIWLLNQQAVRTELEPRLRQLERTLCELETDSANSEDS